MIDGDSPHDFAQHEQESKSIRAAGNLRIAQPKTNAATRAITPPSWLVDTLAEHLASWPVSANRLLFTAPEGGYLRRSFRRRFWKPAVAASVGEPMRFHDLRHTHLALLIK